MMSKVLLAVLVISLAYVSDAVFFRVRYPGKNFVDMADCQEGSETQGGSVRIPSRNGWGRTNFRQCGKYCLKQVLRGDRKGDADLQAIVGSEWTANACNCISGGTPTFQSQAATSSCIFKQDDSETDNDDNEATLPFAGECKSGQEIGGLTEIVPNDGGGLESETACGRYCYNLKLAGEQKGEGDEQWISSSEWDDTPTCNCIFTMSSAYFQENAAKASCIFDADDF